MEDMKKLYESKINDLSDELVLCMCKLEGKIEKIDFTSTRMVKYVFHPKYQELFFAITKSENWYKIKVCDNDNCIILKVEKDNLDITNVYNIMKRKYEEQGEYGKLIDPIHNMIAMLTSHTNK